MTYSQSTEHKCMKAILGSAGGVAALTILFACTYAQSSGQADQEHTAMVPVAQAETASAAENVGAISSAIPQGSDFAAGGGSPAGDVLFARGQNLFAKPCAICHGDTSDGQGKVA